MMMVMAVTYECVRKLLKYPVRLQNETALTTAEG